jgi:hypothetical protein
MTIGTGSVSFSTIQTEFTGANPISLSEYYRGGGTGYVPSGTGNGGYGLISTSGAISVGTFRGTSRAVTISLTISVNTTNYNIRTAAGSPAGAAAVTVTVNSGIYVYGSTTGNYAMDTGTGWAAGSTINVINNGIITGFGGAGGAGCSINGVTFTNPTVGSAGGPGLRAQYAMSISNNGTVAGGGGGGGGGGGSRGNYTKGTYGAAAGGGSGGGRPLGAGDAAGTAVNNAVNSSGTAGGTGTLAAPGAAGARGVIGGISGGGPGVVGGALGTAGATGGSPDLSNANYYAGGYRAGAAGGAAGNYVTGGGNVTWNVVGTRLGGAA